MATTNNQFFLRLQPATYYNILVDWGDGLPNRTLFIGTTENTVSAGLIHTYTTPGDYDVSIIPGVDTNDFNYGLYYGPLSSPAQPNNLFSESYKVKSIKQWGQYSNKITYFSNSFIGCTALSSVPVASLSSNAEFYFGMNGTFQSCYSLFSFPDLYVLGDTGIFYTFQNCINLKTVGNLYIPNNKKGFFNTWNGCSSLLYFPPLSAPQVDNRTGDLYGFTNAWYGCFKMTSFGGLSADYATTLNSSFANCTSLTSFNNFYLPKLSNLNSTFRNCTNLSSVGYFTSPFIYNMNSTFFVCTNLKKFIFPKQLNFLTDLRGIFYGCSNLTDVGFLSAPNITNCDGAFRDCTNLSSLSFSIDTFNKVAGVPSYPVEQTDFTLFCTNNNNLTYISPISTQAVDFYYAWSGCSKLKTISLTATNAIGWRAFYGTWNDCISLSSIDLYAPTALIFTNGTWRNCKALSSFKNSFPEAYQFTDVFNGCDNLRYANISIPKAQLLYNCFNNTPKLNTLVLDAPSGVDFRNFLYDNNSLSALDFTVNTFSKMLCGAGFFYGNAGYVLPTTLWSSILTAICATNFNIKVRIDGGSSKRNTAGTAAFRSLTAMTVAQDPLARQWTINDGGAA